MHPEWTCKYCSCVFPTEHDHKLHVNTCHITEAAYDRNMITYPIDPPVSVMKGDTATITFGAGEPMTVSSVSINTNGTNGGGFYLSPQGQYTSVPPNPPNDLMLCYQCGCYISSAQQYSQHQAEHSRVASLEMRLANLERTLQKVCDTDGLKLGDLVGIMEKDQ